MQKITLNNLKYEIIKDDYKVLNIEEISSLLTEYFETFDYILGDYSYSKLRLKGFYDDKNKKANNINKYSMIESYISNYCAFGCKHFIIKKVVEK